MYFDFWFHNFLFSLLVLFAILCFLFVNVVTLRAVLVNQLFIFCFTHFGLFPLTFIVSRKSFVLNSKNQDIYQLFDEDPRPEEIESNIDSYAEEELAK